jgi:hypothetical protein
LQRFLISRVEEEGGLVVNIYRMIGSSVGTPEAQDLAARLSSWHDAMVAHERSAARPACDDECPHIEAPALWAEAMKTFGDKAAELRFLMSRGVTAARRPAAQPAPAGARS